MTKRDNNLRFMTDLFKDLTEFGKNCFHVQIVRGDHSVQEVAFVNISLLGGDNEHLNYVCGTSSMCNGRNCRRCMSNRTYRFMVEPGECMTRKDNDHEVLSKRLKELRTKQLLRVAGGRNYVKSIPEKDLVALSQNLGITKVGLNVMYSRFWYWNYRGLPGLHASCPPDWLHTILKGAVEKTLSAILILVEFFRNLTSLFSCVGVDKEPVCTHGKILRAYWIGGYVISPFSCLTAGFAGMLFISSHRYQYVEAYRIIHFNMFTYIEYANSIGFL